MIQNLIFFFFFFEDIISVSGIQLFYIHPHVSVDIIRVFFNFLIFQQKVSKPTKTSEKVHSLYNTVLLKKSHSFYEPQLTQHSQHNQNLFSLCKFSNQHFSIWCQKKTFALHHFLTPKNCILESKCLYIFAYLGKEAFVPETK